MSIKINLRFGQTDKYREWTQLTNLHIKIKKLILFAGSCEDCNQTALREEAQLYDDIVVFDFLDTYVNLTIKTIVSLNWIFNVYKTDLYLKVDDDALFNVTDVHQTVLKHLPNQAEHLSNYILGSCLSGIPFNRDLKHRFGVSKEAYSPPIAPRYCTGLSYAITRSAVSLLLNQTHNTPLIHLEDVTLGILAKKAGNINLRAIPFWLVKRPNKSYKQKGYRKYHIIHTSQGPTDQMEELWKYLNSWVVGNGSLMGPYFSRFYSLKQ